MAANCHRPTRKIEKFTNIISLNNYIPNITGLQTLTSVQTYSVHQWIYRMLVCLYLGLSVTNLLPPGKIHNKMKWRAHGIWVIWGEVSPRKKGKGDYFRLEFTIFTTFSPFLRFPNIHVFICYVLSAYYGLSALLGFKPMKIKTKTKKMVPAHPTLNELRVWETTKYSWTMAR